MGKYQSNSGSLFCWDCRQEPDVPRIGQARSVDPCLEGSPRVQEQRRFEFIVANIKEFARAPMLASTMIHCSACVEVTKLSTNKQLVFQQNKESRKWTSTLTPHAFLAYDVLSCVHVATAIQRAPAGDDLVPRDNLSRMRAQHCMNSETLFE